MTFGQLAKGKKITRKLDGKAVTKSASQFAVMGKPEKRTDALAKVTGKAQYAGDIRVPAMLYANFLRPPAHGAIVKNVNTSAAEKMPGVIVVNQDGLIAVLHQDPEAAGKALARSRPNSISRSPPLIMQRYSTTSSTPPRRLRRPSAEEILPQGRRLQPRLSRKISYCLRRACSHRNAHSSGKNRGR